MLSEPDVNYFVGAMKSNVMALFVAGGWFCLGLTMVQSQTFDSEKGLIAYYPFNGDANDQSGNDHLLNNGTVNGATLTTDRFGRQKYGLQLWRR